MHAEETLPAASPTHQSTWHRTYCLVCEAHHRVHEGMGEHEALWGNGRELLEQAVELGNGELVWPGLLQESGRGSGQGLFKEHHRLTKEKG